MSRKTKKQKLVSHQRKIHQEQAVVQEISVPAAKETSQKTQYVIKEPEQQPVATVPTRQFVTRGFTKEQDKETRDYFMQDVKRSSLVIVGIIIIETAIYFLAQNGVVSKFFPY